MSEMAAALRQFADRLERNELGVKFVPASAAIVLSGDGLVSASYIGRDLLALGIEKTVVAKLGVKA